MKIVDAPSQQAVTHSRGSNAKGSARAWQGLNPLGRLTVLALVATALVTVSMGFAIPQAAKQHLLNARMDVLQTITQDLIDAGLVPETSHESEDRLGEFDYEVRTRIVGGETIGVKVWKTDGTLSYASSTDFDQAEPPPAQDLATPAARIEVSHSDVAPRVIEFVFPISDEAGAIVGGFEIEQLPTSFDATMASIRWRVWTTVLVGIASLVILIGALVALGRRTLENRRRHAEDVLRQVVAAQAEERKRIMAALHDDVGQSLYRVMYGLEASQRELSPGDPLLVELTTLSGVISEVESAIRNELRLLNTDDAEQVGLRAAITDLVDTTTRESGLPVEFEHAIATAPAQPVSSILVQVVQEALINIRKHSAASTASVRLWEDDWSTSVQVTDDGIGVAAPFGIGLETLTYRLDAVGGDLDVEFIDGTGTRITASVPKIRSAA